MFVVMVENIQYCILLFSKISSTGFKLDSALTVKNYLPQ